MPTFASLAAPIRKGKTYRGHNNWVWKCTEISHRSDGTPRAHMQTIPKLCQGTRHSDIFFEINGQYGRNSEISLKKEIRK